MVHFESVSPVVGAPASCLVPRPSLPSVAKSISEVWRGISRHLEVVPRVFSVRRGRCLSGPHEWSGPSRLGEHPHDLWRTLYIRR